MRKLKTPIYCIKSLYKTVKDLQNSIYYAVTHKTHFYYVLWSQILHFLPPVVKAVSHIFIHIVSRWNHSLVISNLEFIGFKFQNITEHKMSETKFLFSGFCTLNCTEHLLRNKP